MPDKICPKCGKSSKDVKFAGNFCLEHALEHKGVRAPDAIEVVVCPSCKRVRLAGGGKGEKRAKPRYKKRELKSSQKWVRFSKDIIEKIVNKKFEKSGFEGEYNFDEGVYRGHFDVQGEPVEYEMPANIAYKKIVCPFCSRASGGYFEAVVQVRGEKDEVGRWSRRISKKISKTGNEVSKVEEVANGADLKLVSKRGVEQALSSLKLKFKRTKKLIGERKDTKRLYRDTFLVRV